MGRTRECAMQERCRSLLLKCVSKYESLQVLKEVHEGICGAHQSGVKMR